MCITSRGSSERRDRPVSFPQLQTSVSTKTQPCKNRPFHCITIHNIQIYQKKKILPKTKSTRLKIRNSELIDYYWQMNSAILSAIILGPKQAFSSDKLGMNMRSHYSNQNSTNYFAQHFLVMFGNEESMYRWFSRWFTN